MNTTESLDSFVIDLWAVPHARNGAIRRLERGTEEYRGTEKGLQ